MGEKIMKNRLSRTLTAVIVLALVFTLFAGARFGFFEAKAEEAEVIDMYLIAGQSNAAGYSPILSNETERFENVWYAGMTEKRLRGANGSDSVVTDFTQSFDSFKKSVTGGLGNSSSRIGPEYGIAKTINGMYENSGKQAIIFKTAAGGTSLLDDTREYSSYYGNWYPRSLWEDGYEPDISGYYENNDATGLLYKLFVENFKRVYDELVANGYAPVVKGMAWMQGETNINAEYAKYAPTLQAFITDIRKDLGEITGDKSLSAMPFVIGQIAPTFSSYNNPNVAKIIEQQKAAANAMGDSVALVSTDDLIIVGSDGQRMPGCPDNYHFCFNDAVTLGQRFGEKIVELNGQTLVTASAQGAGKIGYTMNGSSVSFSLAPEKHYHLQSLTVDGRDVTAMVANESFTLTDAPSRVYAEAVFAENEKLALTYADLGNGAEYLRTDNYGYKGETLAVKIYVSDGYTLEKVTFNGEEMPYNEATGKYEIMLTEGGEVAAVITKNSPNNGGTDDGNGGCGSAKALSGASVLIAALAGLLIIKRIR